MGLIKLDRSQWECLALLFNENQKYAGYRPEVLEKPHGDQRVDAAKRFLHIALKYNPPEWALRTLAHAHFLACSVAERIGVSPEFYPRIADGTLRVLDYPAHSGTVEHTDFDLFTVNLWRSTPEDHEQTQNGTWSSGALEYHIGEIGQLAGLGSATPHRVPERPYAQQALVYFAMPDHSAVLPSGQTVRNWLEDRKSRSRTYK